ncbi:phage head closure protein [Fulvimarina sp. 2208YS6-2-32]|uniref:Phage head closure protein n=1 Tax=Fulvimarina uroteuthidis TaxID=3098149 RepID=A0ABU5I156_9HYPH|nr:phage head closure protein [Fulvimarina sp. 2208YS6-2-32]MDY8109111.1 phage head closure protein [Fulvimarina sp. 2208YS6-2-32]
MARPLFIDPGLLSERAVLEAPDDRSDGQGGAVTAWIPVRTVSVHVAPLGAHRFERFDRAQGEIRHRVICRKADDVRRGLRFRLDSRILRIETAHDPDARGRFLLCLCVEDDR